jgi:Flp pilus assembly secretin CpaC
MSRAHCPARSTIALGVAVLASFAADAARADPIFVKIDQATVVNVSKPAATVIVGNPAIADATILDTETIVITGHGYGTTNFFVLDAQGKRITNQLVSVIESGDRSVTVHRRLARQTYSCAPTCAPALAVGDTTERFDTLKTQLNDRRSMASSISAE